MKMKKIFIQDGNFSSWLRSAFILIGGGMVYVSLKYSFSIILLSCGVGLAALGGYSSRAKSSGLKPFDDTYGKSKISYQEDDLKK